MDKWISKIKSTHTMEYCSALKRKGILTFAITQMKLEDIMLSETGEAQKDKCCMISLI